jgi:integrase
MVVEAEAGRYNGTTATFEQLATQWLELVEADLSPPTLRGYRNKLKVRIFPAIGDRPVKKITTDELDRFYRGLVKQAGLSPATVRQINAIVRRALRQAVIWEWITTNPADNVTPPRVTKPKLSPPNADQVDGILHYASIHNPELGHFLHIAASTGARRGEVCALRWSNLDTSKRTLTIEQSIAEVPGGLEEKDTKTHAERRIALDAETLAVFEAQRVIVTDRARSVGIKIPPNAFVFSRGPDCKRPMTPGAITKQFARVRDALGFDKVRLHDMRHFAATRMMTAGVPVRTVSGRLGHANPATTLSVYAHFVEASDQAAAEVMGNLRTKSSKKAPPAAGAKKATAKTSRN